MTGLPLSLDRAQILSFRRRVGGLDVRVPQSPESLRRAAWAGLQDSMPRAALLSLHARIKGVTPDALDDPSLIQVWGPRYSVFVVAAEDRAVFTLGRWPDTDKGRARASVIAARLAEHLDGRRERDHEAGAALGLNPNALRYATTTGTVLIRWEGARAPRIWSVAAPEIDPADAQAELARRYLHVFGPGTVHGFAKWAGVSDRSAAAALRSLAGELIAVRTPLDEASILASDEQAFRAPAGPPAPARLLPSGDTHFLCWGADRQLLVPDPASQAGLWTSRVWPGAVLLEGEVAGTWRRAGNTVTVRAWKRATGAEQDAVESEAADLPIAGASGRIRVMWE